MPWVSRSRSAVRSSVAFAIQTLKRKAEGDGQGLSNVRSCWTRSEITARSSGGLASQFALSGMLFGSVVKVRCPRPGEKTPGITEGRLLLVTISLSKAGSAGQKKAGMNKYPVRVTDRDSI